LWLSFWKQSGNCCYQRQTQPNYTVSKSEGESWLYCISKKERLKVDAGTPLNVVGFTQVSFPYKLSTPSCFNAVNYAESDIFRHQIALFWIISLHFNFYTYLS